MKKEPALSVAKKGLRLGVSSSLEIPRIPFV